MPAKSKAAHIFKVGDAGVVRAGKDRVADRGVITKVTAVHIVFQGMTHADLVKPPTFLFKRKGTQWIESKKDHYRLEPT